MRNLPSKHALQRKNNTGDHKQLSKLNTLSKASDNSVADNNIFIDFVKQNRKATRREVLAKNWNDKRMRMQ